MIFAHLIQSASNLPTDASALESSISALESAISALESDIKILESSSVFWEHSVWVFTFLVVVGVAMELRVIRHEYRDDMEAWALAHFGVLRSPGRPSITKFSVEVGSVLLITIGIMGELGIGVKIASINGVLRGKSAELRSKNAELQNKSDQLLALVTTKAAQLRKKAAEIEERVVWRRLSSDQQSLMTKQLKPFAGRSVLIQFNIGDTESNAFAITIASALLGAHWKVNQPYGGQFLGGIAKPVEKISSNLNTGVHVGQFGNPASSKALVEELNKLGFDAFEDHSFDAAPREVSRDIFVVVDPRPEGPQGEAKLKLEADKKKQATQSSQTTK